MIKHEVVTVGEANGVSADEAPYGLVKTKGKFNMLFQFEHLELWDYENNMGFDPKHIKKFWLNGSTHLKMMGGMLYL